MESQQAVSASSGTHASATTGNFELSIVQQPGDLTSCGFHGDRINRRVIDPCPILQLVIRSSNGELKTK